MAVYLSPGVYLEEIPSGSKPIEGVATSVAAFIGAARKGPAGKAVLIHSLDDYKSEYGDIESEDDVMGLAVQAFYMNGGKDAYVCRLVSNDPPTAAASLKVKNDAGSHDVFTIKASSEGEWGNDLYIRIVKPDSRATTFDLEVGHREDGKFVTDETFSDLTMDAQDDNYLLTQVGDGSSLIEIDLEDAADPDESGNQYGAATLTGGSVGSLDFSTMAASMTLTLNLNGLGAEQITLTTSTLGLAGGAANNAADGALVKDAIVAAVKLLGTDDAYQDFTAAYTGGRFVLTSPKSDSSASITIYDGKAGTSNLAALLKLDSKTKAVFTGAALTLATLDVEGGLAASNDLALNIDKYGSETITIKKADLDLSGDATADAKVVAAAIKNAVRALHPKVPSFKDFTCTFEVDSGGTTGSFVLTSGSASVATSTAVSSPASVITVTTGTFATLLGLDTGTGAYGREYTDGTAAVIPDERLGTLEAGEKLAGGGEAKAAASDFNSFFQNVLRKVRDVSILVLPGQTWAEDGSGNGIISEALSHCEATKSRIVIIDPPDDLELEKATQVDGMSLPTSTYSVLYYPWIKVANPLYDEDKNPTASRTLDIAPSAFAAGMWSKIDASRGVWKAPAGVETQLLGIAGLKYIVEDGEQDQLNPLGVNCIRKIPSFGSVIWGSRTLSTKAKPEWRYVPVRRTAIFLERSIYNGIQWAVFEPNDEPLWSALRTNIDSFMNGLFRAGAFQGAKASDAYFVRCGLGDTMTQGDIDRGQVIVIVGFAPLKPAEFVIVRIQQKVGQQ